MSEAATSLATPADPIRWSPLTRLAFRFVFCYFMLYALCCGNATLWEVIPFHIGEHLEDWTYWPFVHASQWLAQHLFHVQGVGATIHGGGSGDKAIDWIVCGVMLAVAIVATLAWSAIDERPGHRRGHYKTLFGWMRFLLRVALGVAMLNYGLAKVFPLQMSPPSLAVLNEPLGNTSPMTMLWTLIGLNPLYEVICGLAEVAAGVLILFRRTALAGALFTAFVVSNVVLYNYFFDVPVKIYATHLLLMALVVIAPDLRSLADYFFFHKPTLPTGNFMLPQSRRNRRIESIVVTLALLLATIPPAIDMSGAVKRQRAATRNPIPLTGIWHVDSALRQGKPEPLLTPEGQPMVDLILEPDSRVRLRSADGQLWRGGKNYNDQKHTFSLYSTDIAVDYAIAQPDPNHIVLTPTGDDAKTHGVLTLSRQPIPTHYPLQDRGFHFINEWGLER